MLLATEQKQSSPCKVGNGWRLEVAIPNAFGEIESLPPTTKNDTHHVGVQFFEGAPTTAIQTSKSHGGNTLYHVYALTDETGAIAEAVQSYDAYGKISALITGAGTDGNWFTSDDVTAANPNVSAIGNPWLFGGYRIDPETGLYYVKNRFFIPDLGRWASRDPIGYMGGSINLYEYVASSPTKWSDPPGTTQFTWNYDFFLHDWGHSTNWLIGSASLKMDLVCEDGHVKKTGPGVEKKSDDYASGMFPSFFATYSFAIDHDSWSVECEKGDGKKGLRVYVAVGAKAQSDFGSTMVSAFAGAAAAAGGPVVEGLAGAAGGYLGRKLDETFLSADAILLRTTDFCCCSTCEGKPMGTTVPVAVKQQVEFKTGSIQIRERYPKPTCNRPMDTGLRMYTGYTPEVRNKWVDFDEGSSKSEGFGGRGRGYTPPE